ncbi:hypothetical protein [uncultured Bacteroides sp.]|uniref:hypothetical protein n=1 Tax=uncultured Bacteroides sp. TaxID=162156 RepID=UPI0026067387|nr:hypothetical protein [uncultured Bacteroides sp.]
MEDELWMRKIKERLDDYAEPLSVSGWERIERDLAASEHPATTGSCRMAEDSFPPLGCSCGCGAACCRVVGQCMVATKPCGRGSAEYGYTGIGNSCSGQTARAAVTGDTDGGSGTRLSWAGTSIDDGYKQALFAGAATACCG